MISLHMPQSFHTSQRADTKRKVNEPNVVQAGDDRVGIEVQLFLPKICALCLWVTKEEKAFR